MTKLLTPIVNGYTAHWLTTILYALRAVLSQTIMCSDARLFCKNKQYNMKNKPKIGNLTQEQAQHALAGKFNKTNNRQVNYLEKDGRKSEKTHSKWTKFHKTTPTCLFEQIESENCHKFWRKSNQKNRNPQKTSQKNEQISVKISAKTSNPQVLRKTEFHKKKHKFVGKPQGWQHWSCGFNRP